MSSPAATTIRIDFVSDVSCPWCAIGLSALGIALGRLGEEADIELHFQPFELNPQMGRDGEPLVEHLARKYGSSPEQIAHMHETIRQRGADVGFVFCREGRDRIYNTFDAHRLLHWAGLADPRVGGPQHRLKLALLRAYFTQGKDPSAHDVLVEAVADVGLDAEEARQILLGDAYADAVREQQRFYTEAGINSVPAVIVDQRYLISGGQPADVFEQSLRRVIADKAA